MNTNDQILMVVDDKDNFLGYEKRVVCHTGLGKRHRAFATLLFDKDKKVFLQRRKHRLFDNLWDLTAISHPLHIDGRDETWQEASDRALTKEMGIEHVEIENIGGFNYYAKDGKNCENEHCVVLIGNYDGELKSNPEEVYEVKKVGYKDFIGDVDKSPSKYAPWAILAAGFLRKHFK